MNDNNNNNNMNIKSEETYDLIRKILKRMGLNLENSCEKNFDTDALSETGSSEDDCNGIPWDYLL